LSIARLESAVHALQATLATERSGGKLVDLPSPF
jgi:hypothetical protein